MTEILLTPLPQPGSPVDPDMRPLTRAPSQSTEFFNSVFVDSAYEYSGTKPLRVVKKAPVVHDRTSTVSVPSSPISLRSSEGHPHQTISKVFLAMDMDQTPCLSDITYLQPFPSPPLTPDLTPVAPKRPPHLSRAGLPISPVTPTRAPAKALKLLGTQTDLSLPKKKRDHLRPAATAKLVEIEKFFGAASRKPIKAVSSKNLKPRNARKGHSGERNAMRPDVEDEPDLTWLMSDPADRSNGRTDMGRYASDEEDWSIRAFSNTIAQPVSDNGKRVDESFVDLFGDGKVKSRSSKPRLKGKGRSSVPHPWSAAALSDTPSLTPALVSRSTFSSNSSSSSCGPSSPDSDSHSSPPPRRPKKRPPPLILDLKPKANLPIVILNSPPAHSSIKKPLTPVRSTRPPSIQSAQTPFVHPRRAPKPIPRAVNLHLDLAKAALPRTTDTRMPLLPPLPIMTTPEDELLISVFEPVTPTDAQYPAHIGFESGDRKGGWLKKVVRDFSQVKL